MSPTRPPTSGSVQRSPLDAPANTAELDRRAFLRVMGVTGAGLFLALPGCSRDTGTSIEEGAEIVTSYVDPEEFAVPGHEVWYASSCRQCPAGCGIHARVLEGRVRKLEGNPDSPVNQGRLCAMGQAGLQHHYNPQRLQRPLVRQNGALVEIGWGEAHTRLHALVGASAQRGGAGFALLTGEASGHAGLLAREFVAGLGPAARHHVYEPLSNATARLVNQRVSGVATPRLNLIDARLVVSFGADFLGTWRSPVHFATQYASLREAPRGALIQIEPKMSITGSNADWWRPIRAGTEEWLMLGVAQLLLRDPQIAARLTDPALRKTIDAIDLAAVATQTDIPADHIERLAKALRERSPSLVLVGGPAESSAAGSRNVAAGWLLNHLLGNIGVTLTAPEGSRHPELAASGGSTAALKAWADGLPGLDTVFIAGSNPAYSAPQFLGLRDKLAAVRNKVVFAAEMNETAALADLVIPLRSYLEDWDTRVPEYNPTPGMVHLQQPVMQALHADIPGLPDLLLGWLGRIDPQRAQWPGFHDYLRAAVGSLRSEAESTGFKPYKLPALAQPPVFAPANPEDAFAVEDIDRAFWEGAVARGLLQLQTTPAPAFVLRLEASAPLAAAVDPQFPFALIPSPRNGLYDGRHANLPWLQELPDQLTTIVWDSWAELHPHTAARLKLEQGDWVEIASAQGRFEVKVMLFPGIHPESVAVPLGQGHEVGDYAKGVGVNPLRILAPTVDAGSGEHALYGTAVSVRKLGRKDVIVKMAPTEYQHGRRIVRTVAADTVNNHEKG